MIKRKSSEIRERKSKIHKEKNINNLEILVKKSKSDSYDQIKNQEVRMNQQQKKVDSRQTGLKCIHCDNSKAYTQEDIKDSKMRVKKSKQNLEGKIKNPEMRMKKSKTHSENQIKNPEKRVHKSIARLENKVGIHKTREGKQKRKSQPLMENI